MCRILSARGSRCDFWIALLRAERDHGAAWPPRISAPPFNATPRGRCCACRLSSSGDSEVIDPEGRGIGAGFELEVVGRDQAGEDLLQIARHRHLADRERDLALLDPEARGAAAVVAGD